MIFAENYAILDISLMPRRRQNMDDKQELPTEEYDNGSSIEKTIEQLDKDDPEYADKREKMINKLYELRKKLTEQHKQITKQRKELKQLLKNLHSQASQNPKDDKIQNLIADIELDRAFLTRASAEIISLKGNWNNEMGKLAGSKNFNLPLDIKLISDTELKPLPSSELNRKKEQVKENGKKKASSPANSGKHRTSASLTAAKILQLRQTTAERTTAGSTKLRQHTR